MRSKTVFLVLAAALALASCTKRKPEEVDYAPDSPFNPYPADGATNVEHTTLDVTLRWTATDPNSGDVLVYDLYFDTLNPPANKVAAGLAVNNYFMTGLSYNTLYYWKLYITDDKGVITSGPVWQFTTLPHANTAPDIPTYIYPANNASWEYPTLSLRWNGTDPEGGSDTLYYDLYLGITPDPSVTLFKNDLVTVREFTGLNYATTYYWKVAVRDNHYAYTEGPLYSFTTRDCPWFYKMDMPSPRYGFGTAVVNDRIYVIGGHDGINYLSEVLEYDPSSDIWTRKADMPTPRSNLAVAIWNGKIYAMGGRTTYGFYTDINSSNEVYNPAIDVWDSLSPLPVASENILSAHAVKGKIYTFGPVMEYDAATDSWWDTVTYHQDTTWTDTTCTVIDTIVDDSVVNHIKSDLPYNRHYHCSAAYNNLIYVMGGIQWGKSFSSPAVDVYHPGTNSWSAAREMIGPANFPAAAVANGFIYVIGGYDDTYSKRVRKYDPLSDSWFIRSDLQAGRSFLGAAYVGGNIYAIGGISPAILPTVEEYQLGLDPKR